MSAELKAVGARVKVARKAAGMSQAELAEKLNISVSHVGDIETGKTNFGVDILMRITESLQISADSLLRTNVPSVNSVYAKELEEILDGCTTAQKEAMLNTMKNMKTAFHIEK